MSKQEQGGAMPGQPWWKFGHVWLVVAGPAVVVIAGFITLWLAVRTPDPVVTTDNYRQSAGIDKTLEGSPAALAPAVQARNHAATGALPVTQPADKP
jgi:hypothetical protein